MTDDRYIDEEDRLAEEARALKDVPPETNPDAAGWPEEVKTERVDDDPGE